VSRYRRDVIGRVELLLDRPVAAVIMAVVAFYICFW